MDLLPAARSVGLLAPLCSEYKATQYVDDASIDLDVV
jgi:hypothetical protein